MHGVYRQPHLVVQRWLYLLLMFPRVTGVMPGLCSHPRAVRCAANELQDVSPPRRTANYLCNSLWGRSMTALIEPNARTELLRRLVFPTD
jgi:hypothetical protein